MSDKINRMKRICDKETFENNTKKTPSELLVEIKKKYILQEYARYRDFWDSLFISNLELFQALNDRLKKQF